MPAIEWMQKGPFGVMVHWCEATASGPGEPDLQDWNEKVDAFPVEQFCDDIAATGAAWLIFPIGHSSSSGVFCSPNTKVDEVVPGLCSNRDLFKEIAEGITQRGLKMMAYMSTKASSIPLSDALGWDDDPVDKKPFQRKFAAIIREWSVNMGPLISGWWFDGAYSGPRTGYTFGNERFEGVGWTEAVVAGNPDSVYCLNSGANTYQYCVEDEGFLAGKASHLHTQPGMPLVGDKQWHALLWTDCFWQHTEPGKKIDGPRFFDPELHRYLKRVNENGGAATLNIGIYQNGKLAEESAAQLTRLSELLKSGSSPQGMNRYRVKYT